MIVRSSGEIVVLHRISEDKIEAGPYAQMTETPARLEQYLDINKYAPRGSWPQICSGNVDDGWSLITFDDGYRDTLEVALPLLEKYQMPAVVFVTVGFLAKELEPFSAYVARLIYGLENVSIDGQIFQLKDEESFEQAWRKAYRGMERGSTRKRWQRLEHLAVENGLSLPASREDVYLDWNELRELSKHPLITIGAHSWTHPRLSRVSPWSLRLELFGARRRIEQELGVEVPLLAYPHGAHNWFVRTVARAAGYSFAFTTMDRQIIQGDCLDQMAVPRVSLP